MHKILFVFGTRPEAIKVAPVIKELQSHPDVFQTVVCVTAQHRQMLDQVLDIFQIQPDYDLDIMTAGQDLFDVTCNVLMGLKPVIFKERPAIVLVHGDTTTTMAAALSAYYGHFKVGHIEAGLRTYDKFAPFPEEINRKVAGCLTDLHFAPTASARENLLQEGVPEQNIFVTGNTVIDALLNVSALIDGDTVLKERLSRNFDYLDASRKLILVTGHRRENFNEGFINICKALGRLAEMHQHCDILYPVHLNPNVQDPVNRLLGGEKYDNVHLIAPVDYLSFVYLLKRACLVITDSGGIQEEAPSLSKPVLVMRDKTERPEAVEAGTVKLVGTDIEKIVKETSTLLTDEAAYRCMCQEQNPYGDGLAAQRIAQILLNRL
ncbi:MAG: UDP-N-acetylglucosamine 2-epimerase (non-hydrolyzing) [Deltaproteobacteria bacterium]|nr:UDP-N-acetylglucosamine 2-epimerase (non-hydrolyzing) [Deltaproteobacteria bacterium]